MDNGDRGGTVPRKIGYGTSSLGISIHIGGPQKAGDETFCRLVGQG